MQLARLTMFSATESTVGTEESVWIQLACLKMFSKVSMTIFS